MARDGRPAGSRAAFATPAQQLDLVLFLDGHERAGVALERPVEEFRRSWRRPKRYLLARD